MTDEQVERLIKAIEDLSVEVDRLRHEIVEALGQIEIGIG